MDDGPLSRDDLDEVLAERMNDEPPILRGCTSSELGLIVMLSIGIWIPLGLVIAAVLGAIGMTMGIAAIGIVGTVFGAFVGLVVGLQLIAFTIRRQRKDYEADRASCVACGRCFAYCPRERVRRGDLQDKGKDEQDRRIDRITG